MGVIKTQILIIVALCSVVVFFVSWNSSILYFSGMNSVIFMALLHLFS